MPAQGKGGREAKSGKKLSRKARGLRLADSAGDSGTETSSSTVYTPELRNRSRRGSDDVGDITQDDLRTLAKSMRNIRVHMNSGPGSEVDQFFTPPPPDPLEKMHEQLTARDFKRLSQDQRADLIDMNCQRLTGLEFTDKDAETLNDMHDILLKSAMNGFGTKEGMAAIRALAISAITSSGYGAAGNFFSESAQVLKACIMNPTSRPCQADAIHALGSATFFGRADQNEVDSVMAFLLKIIQSNGESIEAEGVTGIVVAAVQEWGFLATLVRNEVPKVYEALEKFEELLEPNTPKELLVAVAENIALLYEKTYALKDEFRVFNSRYSNHPDSEDKSSSEDENENAEEEEEEDDEEDGGELSEPELDPTEESRVPTPYRQEHWKRRWDISLYEHELRTKARQFSKGTFKGLKGDARKEVHAVFRDLMHTLEYPWRGPRFSTALNPDGDRYYGHRIVIRTPNARWNEAEQLVMDRWWKLHRYNAIKRVLKHGFFRYWRSNELVQKALPDSLEASRMVGSPSRSR